MLDEEGGGLKLQVEDDKPRDGMISKEELVVGEALPAPVLVDNMCVSLIEGKERGDLTTEPGVRLGSSSMLFNGFPYRNNANITSHPRFKIYFQ